MNDLISRQDAIDTLEEHLDYLQKLNKDENPKAESEWYGVNWARNTIADLPSAQPEVLTCGNGELDAQSEQLWIPVSERLPDDTTYENVLVVVYCTKSGTVDVGWYEAFFKKWWRLEPDEETREEVIAWMPLPAPLKSEGL